MDADNRGLEESAGRMDGAGNYFQDGGGDGAGEDDFADLSDASAEASCEPAHEDAAQVSAEGSAESESDVNAEQAPDVYEIDPSPHSLLSVLFPAKPPRPRNARIIRLFDLEAGKNDAEEIEPPVEEPPKEEPRTRESIRAARNQSLAVAARLRLGS